MRIPVNEEHMALFECLSSRTRVRMLELLGSGAKNITRLAAETGISAAMATRHVGALERCGFITTETVPAAHGQQKICRVVRQSIELVVGDAPELRNDSRRTLSIPIGQYSAYSVKPSCGLASRERLIGICDDPRYFSSPERHEAALLWFGSGWVEYGIPSYLLAGGKLKSLSISMELCSEYPGAKQDFPSDIAFSLGAAELGVWQSPGDFGDRRGAYTPNWWQMGTQYGMIKTLRIEKNRTLLDGVHLSSVGLDDALGAADAAGITARDVRFRIASPETAAHPGGINLFGRGFGNYDQDIEISVELE